MCLLSPPLNPPETLILHPPHCFTAALWQPMHLMGRLVHLEPVLVKVHVYKDTNKLDSMHKADLLTWCTKDCVCQISKIAHAIILACLPSWICRIGADYHKKQNTGWGRCKCNELAPDLSNLKLIVVDAFAFIFSMFQRQVQTGTAFAQAAAVIPARRGPRCIDRRRANRKYFVCLLTYLNCQK